MASIFVYNAPSFKTLTAGKNKISAVNVLCIETLSIRETTRRSIFSILPRGQTNSDVNKWTIKRDMCLLWWGIVMEDCDVTLWWDIVIGDFYWGLWWVIVMSDCDGRLWWKIVTEDCDGTLWLWIVMGIVMEDCDWKLLTKIGAETCVRWTGKKCLLRKHNNSICDLLQW